MDQRVDVGPRPSAAPRRRQSACRRGPGRSTPWSTSARSSPSEVGMQTRTPLIVNTNVSDPGRSWKALFSRRRRSGVRAHDEPGGGAGVGGAAARGADCVGGRGIVPRAGLCADRLTLPFGPFGYKRPTERAGTRPFGYKRSNKSAHTRRFGYKRPVNNLGWHGRPRRRSSARDSARAQDAADHPQRSTRRRPDAQSAPGQGMAACRIVSLPLGGAPRGHLAASPRVASTSARRRLHRCDLGVAVSP